MSSRATSDSGASLASAIEPIGMIPVRNAAAPPLASSNSAVPIITISFSLPPFLPGAAVCSACSSLIPAGLWMVPTPGSPPTRRILPGATGEQARQTRLRRR
jgi:hypothetical protein